MPARKRHHKSDAPLHTVCDMDCENCIRLSAARCDQCVRLVNVEGGRGLRRRLAELGMTPGGEVRVVQNFGGPLILAVKEDARMALGRGMAHKILVHPIDEGR